MQGESLESARVEIGRDQAARSPRQDDVPRRARLIERRLARLRDTFHSCNHYMQLLMLA
jgi:hypothetical protein